MEVELSFIPDAILQVQLTSEVLRFVTTLVQILGLPVFVWIITKLRQIYRMIKLNSFKNAALINTLSKHLEIGNFMEEYTAELERLKNEYNFIYKEK